MTQTKRLLPKAILLGSLAFSSILTAEEAEGNHFIVSKLAGSDHPRTRNEKAHLQFRSGDYLKASKTFEAILANDPSNGQAWYNLGISQLNLQNYGSAIRSFHTAMKTGLGEKPRYHLALALVNQGEVIGAIDHLKSVVKTQPKHDLAWTLLGRCFETYGRFGQAKNCYKKALAIDPEQGQALFLLENLPQNTQGTIPNLAVMANSLKAPRDETSTTRSEPLPLSRVLSRDGQATQAHQGPLPPLHKTYHLSSDMPNGVKLTPTKEADWTSIKKSQSKNRPLPTMAPPKVNIPLEEL
jgi:tetratricopeptide (TPR) repeat protein